MKRPCTCIETALDLQGFHLRFHVKTKHFWYLSKVIIDSESKSIYMEGGWCLNLRSPELDIKLCTLPSCRCEWASSLLCWSWSTPFCHVQTQTAARATRHRSMATDSTYCQPGSSTLTSILLDTCYYWPRELREGYYHGHFFVSDLWIYED